MVLRRVAGAHRVGQLAGILRFLVSIGEYYSKMDEQLFAKFPAAMWGEAVVVIQIAGGIILAVFILALLPWIFVGLSWALGVAVLLALTDGFAWVVWIGARQR